METFGIKALILKEFGSGKALTTTSLAKKFKVSRQAVHKHIQDLIQQGQIQKQGHSRKGTFYILNSPTVLRKIWKDQKVFRKRYMVKNLEEDKVYREIQSQPQLLTQVPENARSLFHYAFTEILNNAIDHSGSRLSDVLVEINPQTVSFVITDYGIGIFENIRSQKKLHTEMEALQDLLKGKQTTLPEYHSGEGIFFTSKAADKFIIESHHKKLTIDNRLNDIFIEDIRCRKGTRVLIDIDVHSKKKMETIFQKYTNEDYRFDKSQVTVKLFQEGGEYVSRSQAKRLLHSLDRFHEITLDFQGVKTIGQGFADEIFRVFKKHHPEIQIHPIHCHENVNFMIQRAESSDSLLT